LSHQHFGQKCGDVRKKEEGNNHSNEAEKKWEHPFVYFAEGDARDISPRRHEIIFLLARVLILIVVNRR
jgi:hypothetical protein